MKFVENVLSVLAFNNSGQGLGAWIQRVYFAIWYNTTSVVNTMIALGSVTPYLIYLAVHQELTFERLSLAVAITLLSAYCYSLIYIINDYIDRKKDDASGVPKFTARHVLGRYYLAVAAGVFAVIMSALALLWPHAFALVLAYALTLCLLSVLHSRWRTGKPLTIFIERLAKFCAPLWLISVITGDHHAAVCLIGALIVYPLGFTMDYAYRGYFRDRLRRPTSHRFYLYSLYWLLVIIDVTASYHFNLLPLAEPVEYYLGGYLLITGAAMIAARIVPMPFLGNHYDPHVAGEKRRLLSYTFMQTAFVIGSLAYVLFA